MWLKSYVVKELKNMIKIKSFESVQSSDSGRSGCILIAFPGANVPVQYRTVPKIILARPGEELPKSIPDFRPLLQRDGLILLSWDKKLDMNGALYTAYWVTSTGIHRYYASAALSTEDFRLAMPNRKSYAAEDGIDFYGDPSPLYMVHVAPELMMSSREKISQRPNHIKKLKSMGVSADFDYIFLLKTERNKSTLFPKSKEENSSRKDA
jgi:hypothetical protein